METTTAVDVTSRKPSWFLLAYIHYSKVIIWIIQIVWFLLFNKVFQTYISDCDTDKNIFNKYTTGCNENPVDCGCTQFIKEECSFWPKNQPECDQYCSCDAYDTVYNWIPSLIALLVIKGLFELFRFFMIIQFWYITAKKNKSNRYKYFFYHSLITGMSDSFCLRCMQFCVRPNIVSIIMVQLYYKKMLFKQNHCCHWLFGLQFICDIGLFLMMIFYPYQLEDNELFYLFVIGIICAVLWFIAVIFTIYYRYIGTQKPFVDREHDQLFSKYFDVGIENVAAGLDKKLERHFKEEPQGHASNLAPILLMPLPACIIM